MAIASAAKPGAAGRHQQVQRDRQRGEAGRGRLIHVNSVRQLPPRVEADNYKASYLRM
jgi:hypothetical protein